MTEEPKKEEKKKVETPKITLGDPKILLNCISAIGELVSEAKMMLSKENLTIRCMDPANVAMIDLVMDKKLFTEYRIAEPTEVMVNVLNFKQFLQRAKGKAILVLNFTETKFLIDIIGNTKKQFSLPIIDDDSKEVKKPDLEFNATAEVDTKLLKDAFEDAGVVSSSIMFTAKDKMLLLKGEGDLSDAEIEMPDDVKVIHQDEQNAKYAIEYLNRMVPVKLFEKVKINFSTDYPLYLEYQDDSGCLKMTYTLAPRVESD